MQWSCQHAEGRGGTALPWLDPIITEVCVYMCIHLLALNCNYQGSLNERVCLNYQDSPIRSLNGFLITRVLPIT